MTDHHVDTHQGALLATTGRELPSEARAAQPGAARLQWILRADAVVSGANGFVYVTAVAGFAWLQQRALTSASPVASGQAPSKAGDRRAG